MLHKRSLFTKVVVAFAATVMLVGSASAATIGMEAESFDSLAGDGFDILSDIDAGEPLGGEYITTRGDTTNSPPVDRAIYNFNVDAADAGGGYNLYMRVAVGPGGGSEDSIFVPDAMGSDPGWESVNSFAITNGGQVFDVDGNRTDNTPPNFFWKNVTDPAGTQGSAPTYTLVSGTNTFVLGGREPGFRVDAMVFSTNTNETSESLTAAVPEPSSFALLAGCFGLAWVMIRRRA